MPRTLKIMKRHHGSLARFLVNFFLFKVAMLSVFAEEENTEFSTWSFTLGGYIPKFYENQSQMDPFAELKDGESGIEPKEYEESVVSYLEQHGIEAEKIVFLPKYNALLITDTLQNLAGHEIMLRALFRPDMQLRAIDGAISGLALEGILEGDRIDRIGLLGDTTFRAFHGEVRKLEAQLKFLPDDNQERENIEKKLILARDYRDLAIKGYIKSLKEQKDLIERWQKAAK